MGGRSLRRDARPRANAIAKDANALGHSAAACERRDQDRYTAACAECDQARRPLSWVGLESSPPIAVEPRIVPTSSSPVAIPTDRVCQATDTTPPDRQR